MASSPGSEPHYSEGDADAAEPVAEPGAGPRYRSLGLLGAGGMGEVHVVHDAVLDRDVARKTPRSVEGAAALRREAATTARLEHPGIVPVYDAGQDDGGPWYTMRLVRGRTLTEAICKARDPASRLALLRPLLAAVDAVAYAHARGVVHRDLKADNVVLGEHGEVQVLDWGLAVEGAAPGRAGTLATMSPEQARGDGADARSDVWALGIVLAEVLLGGPLPGDAADAERRARRGDVPRPDRGRVPPELSAILDRCLTVDPAQRYPDASGLSAELRRYLDGQLIQSYAYRPLDHLRRFVARHRAAVGVLLLAAALVSAVTLEAFRRTRAEREAARAAERVAVVARKASERHAADALLAAAWAAQASDRLPEASMLAAEALGLRESAAARGVMAASAGVDVPRRTALGLAPRCDRTVADPADGERWACLAGSTLSLWTGLEQRWSVELPDLQSAAFDGVGVVAALRGHRFVFLTPDGAEAERQQAEFSSPLASGRGAVHVPTNRGLLTLRRGEAPQLAPIYGDATLELPTPVAGGLLVVCGGRRLARVDGAGVSPGPELGFSDPQAVIWALASGPTGRSRWARIGARS